MRGMKVVFALAVLFVSIPVYGSLVDGLVAHWTFDETSGNTANDSVGSADGSLYSDATWTDGMIDGGLQFSGSGYVSFLNWSSLNIDDGQMSISLWFKPSSSSASVNSNSQMIGKWLGTNVSYTLGYSDSSNTIVFGVKASNKVMAYSSVAVDNVNQWYNIVGVYDGTNQIVYVNNVAGTAVANSGNVRLASQNLRISGYTNNTYRLNGTMDDVRIYNRALSSSEVAELYATPEPATIFLLGMGSVLLVRKHKK